MKLEKKHARESRIQAVRRLSGLERHPLTSILNT